MRRKLLTVAAGLGLAPLFGLLAAQAGQLQGSDPRIGQPLLHVLKPPIEQCESGTCGKFGTAVEFVGSPKEAAQRAQKEEKLVFVLHLSGIFEDPNLT
jgi:hypothetical protein